MALENSTSSLDTQMAKENAIKQVVTSGKDSLHQLGSWIKANAAKATLFTALTFTAPTAFGQIDVAKNVPKNKIETPIGTAKKDTNSVETKGEPEWRRELDKAILNTLDYMNKNYEKFNKETSGLDITTGNKLVNRFQYIGKYNKKTLELSKVLSERPLTNEEIVVIENIQKKLTERSTEGLHSFLDKLAYLGLQEANALALSFKNSQIVKN